MSIRTYYFVHRLVPPTNARTFQVPASHFPANHSKTQTALTRKQEVTFHVDCPYVAVFRSHGKQLLSTLLNYLFKPLYILVTSQSCSRKFDNTHLLLIHIQAISKPSSSHQLWPIHFSPLSPSSSVSELWCIVY